MTTAMVKQEIAVASFSKVYDLEQVVRIRTGETGKEAL